MSALAFMHKPGSRLPELNPFDLEKADQREAPWQQGLKRLGRPLITGPESAYGCVEWFQYLDHPGDYPCGGRRPRQHSARRP